MVLGGEVQLAVLVDTRNLRDTPRVRATPVSHRFITRQVCP